MVNFPTRIPDCDSYSPALLDFFISSGANICSTVAFPPLGNFDQVDVSVSIGFLSNSKRDVPFDRTAYGYSHADLNGLHDQLENASWMIFLNSVLFLLLPNIVSGSSLELMYLSLIINMVLSCFCYCHSSYKSLLLLASTK